MILGINQPYFVPYLGYWQLVNSVDVFALADDYNYIKNGWINRNYILFQGEKQWFSLPVRHVSQNRLICDHEIVDFNAQSLYTQLHHAYAHAPYFKEGMEVVTNILQYPDRSLSGFLFHSHLILCEYLGIHTRLIQTSSLTHAEGRHREQRIYDYCHQLKADTYHNLIGGVSLYDRDSFQREGITLKFVRSELNPYPQQSAEFVPGLSIIDIIMNNSCETAHRMLSDCSLISGL